MTINKVLRFFLYFFLGLMAIYYLMPLYIMLITSVKSLSEIKTGNLLAFPGEISFSSWSTAWSKACAGVHCVGLKPYFWNSIIITVPAVIISTMVGAINGYVLTKWKFKGSEIFFALILFGCFIPFQIVLLPMARTLGILGLAGTAPGLILVHVVYGICFTTLFFRNFYITVSDEIVKAALLMVPIFLIYFLKYYSPFQFPSLSFLLFGNLQIFGMTFFLGFLFPKVEISL